MLAGTVDAGEGFFVQQAVHAMAPGRALEHSHGQLLVVGGHIRRFKEGSDLKLAGGYLIVASFGGNAQLV